MHFLPQTHMSLLIYLGWRSVVENKVGEKENRYELPSERYMQWLQMRDTWGPDGTLPVPAGQHCLRQGRFPNQVLLQHAIPTRAGWSGSFTHNYNCCFLNAGRQIGPCFQAKPFYGKKSGPLLALYTII